MQTYFQEIDRDIQWLENHFLIVEFLEWGGQLLRP
jgi:hypothetical protein